MSMTARSYSTRLYYRTRRGRFVPLVELAKAAVLTVAVIGAIVAVAGRAPDEGARLAAPPYHVVEHTVAPGETLWGLWRHYAPERSFYAWQTRVCAYNRIENPSLLQPGLVLSVYTRLSQPAQSARRSK